MRAVAGLGASPAFTRMAKGLCVAPPPMEGGAIGSRWGARWGDGGCELGRALGFIHHAHYLGVQRWQVAFSMGLPMLHLRLWSLGPQFLWIMDKLICLPGDLE